ncbi:MAG: bifunctional oligoribonuclease/PAP phosphatase NrnA [Lachnospiraceae bacterium]|nr:bifunctional oligoribonuclease/PAP phosphatase NrnA [Lachnospiraceae bacterium]
MFESIMDGIRSHSRIILHRHTNPDGDALGSQIGLYHLIRDNFPEKEVYKVGDGAGRYEFMEGSVMDEIGDEVFSGAYSIILDSATEELVNDRRFHLADSSARIDHHIYCETFTDTEIVDTSYESCAGMIATLAKESGLTLSSAAATAIFTGMVTDSGRFRYDSTNARTFSNASYLMNAGIDTASIYRNLYSEDLKRAQLRAGFVSKIQKYKDSAVAYIYNTAEDLKELGITDTFTVSRGMVNCMADLKGIDIWANFTEDGEKVLVELRSSRYNINPVAVKYGGGGHEKASGCDVKDHAEALALLEDLLKITE